MIQALERLERALQRLDLAHAAAFLVAVAVEGEQALRGHQLLHRLGLREEGLDRDPVVLAHLFDELVGLGMQAAGVEREHPEPSAGFARHVDENHVLGTAEGDGDVGRVLLECDADQIARLLAGPLLCERGNLLELAVP